MSRQISQGDDDGTVLGQSASDKIAFHGSTPVVQQSFVADPSGGATTDAEARSAINDILDILETYGLMASS